MMMVACRPMYFVHACNPSVCTVCVPGGEGGGGRHMQEGLTIMMMRMVMA
jgi:hypothetical protein